MQMLQMANQSRILKEVDLPEDLCSYIQKLNYEMEGYKAINKTLLIQTGEYTYSRDLYSFHMQKFQEANFAYQVGMTTITEMFAPEFLEDTTISISINFVTGKATFSTKSESHGCKI